MSNAVVKQGRANWEELQRRVAAAERADPALQRAGERFRQSLARRQARSLARIMQNPQSKAYRDYIETPATFDAVTQ